MKVSKIPLKDIILNTLVHKKKGRSKVRGIIGFILMVFAVILTLVSGTDSTSNSLSILLVIISNIMLVPYYTAIFLAILKNIYTYIFGNEGVLAVKNLKENKSIMNNISMLIIGISSLLLINITSFHTLNDIVNFFETSLHYDIYLYSSSFNKTVEPSIRKIDGIVDTMGVYSASGVELKGKNQSIGTLEGVNINKIQEFMNLEFMQGEADSILTELESGRNIIMCNMLKSTFGVKLGDTITLRLGSKDRDYKIAGFLNSMMMGGNYAIISERFFKQDAEPQSYSYFAVKTNKDADKVLALAKNKLIRKKTSGLTVSETMEMVKNQNQQIFMMMNGFTFMTIVISIFGVLNNLIISFIERRRTFAILRSVGMSKFQILKMVFIEAFTSGIIGGIVGVITGFVLIWITSLMMKEYAINIPLALPVNMVIIALFSAVFITLAASLTPALKTSKLNIIQMLKYE